MNTKTLFAGMLVTVMTFAVVLVACDPNPSGDTPPEALCEHWFSGSSPRYNAVYIFKNNGKVTIRDISGFITMDYSYSVSGDTISLAGVGSKAENAKFSISDKILTISEVVSNYHILRAGTFQTLAKYFNGTTWYHSDSSTKLVFSGMNYTLTDDSEQIISSGTFTINASNYSMIFNQTSPGTQTYTGTAALESPLYITTSISGSSRNYFKP